MKSKEGVKIIKEKSATAQQRFTWFLVTDQESNLFLARAVAFLMFIFLKYTPKLTGSKLVIL